MAITVKNMSTGILSLPRPFVKNLAAGASATEYGLMLDSIEKGPLAKLQTLENAGLAMITEVDEVLQRGSVADASVSDVEQYIEVGQSTAADGSVSAIMAVRRPSVLKQLRCYFDAVPDTTETITIDLLRNGTSILSTPLVVGTASTLPSEDAVPIADFLDKTDGAVLTADPNEFNSAGVTFTAAHVGNILMLNSKGVNDGAYILSSYTDANNMDCTDLEGVAATFVTESGIEWDMVLALQAGDVLSLTATVANKSLLGYWTAQAIIQPR